MEKVELYTWRYCPFCKDAIKLLDKKGITYEEYNIENDHAKKKELFEITGQNTVPYVFINNKFIGGYDQLLELEKENKL